MISRKSITPKNITYSTEYMEMFNEKNEVISSRGIQLNLFDTISVNVGTVDEMTRLIQHLQEIRDEAYKDLYE